jgi:hypothetical protein
MNASSFQVYLTYSTSLVMAYNLSLVSDSTGFQPGK